MAWYNEPRRHALSAKGVKTAVDNPMDRGIRLSRADTKTEIYDVTYDKPVYYKGEYWEVVNFEDGEYTLDNGKGKTAYASPEEVGIKKKTRKEQYRSGEVLPLKEQRANYEEFIIDNIDDPDDPRFDEKTPKQKLEHLQETFKDEYGFAIQREGEMKARADWLSGLPSSIDTPYMNDDILTLAKNMGSLRKNATEKEEDRILDNYWNYLSNQIGRLNKKYGVK